MSAASTAPPLWWCESPWPGNYGDLIGPWLYRRMTGRAPVRGRRGAAGVVHSVGSIAALAGPGTIVWGAGTMKPGDLPDPQADYRAVRGPLTREAILRRGGRCPRVYGDPALLLPRVIPRVAPQHKVGIVAHYVDEGRVRALYGDVPGVRVISMLTRDVRGKTLELLACEHLLSSSLHGLIVAQAYGIPARWVIWSDAVLGGGWKFRDYLEAVQLDHEPLSWKARAQGLSAARLAGLTVEQHPLHEPAKLLAACPWSR